MTKEVTTFFQEGFQGITLLNTETKGTAKYLLKKRNATSWFIKIRTGNGPWTYLGMLLRTRGKTLFKITKKTPTDTKLRELGRFLVKYINYRSHYTKVEASRHTLCMYCGNRLTTPKSIKLGYGPICGGR